MQITRTLEAGAMHLAVSGRLDGYWADHLDNALSEAVRENDSALIRELLVELGGRLPRTRPSDAVEAEGFARGFLAPVIEPGVRVMRAATALAARDLLRNKRAMLRLNLPPAELLFLLRIRFGLYAVLEQLAARCDWAALEAELAALGPARAGRGPG